MVVEPFDLRRSARPRYTTIGDLTSTRHTPKWQIRCANIPEVLILRHAFHSGSARTIALWADACPRLTGWQALNENRDPLIRAFAWLFRGCLANSRAPGGADRGMSGTTPSQPAVLMLSGRADPVFPPGVQSLWVSAGKLKPQVLILDSEHVMDDARESREVSEWIDDRQEVMR